GADLALAWPSAKLAVMGSTGVVEILNRRELEEAGDGRAALRASLATDYAEQYANPWIAAERGFVDEVIEPTQTRAAVAIGLAMLRSKRRAGPRRKHGNVPL